MSAQDNKSSQNKKSKAKSRTNPNKKRLRSPGKEFVRNSYLIALINQEPDTLPTSNVQQRISQ